MSRSLLALALMVVVSAQHSEPPVGELSCCECSLDGQEIKCECSQQMPDFCEFPETPVYLDASEYRELSGSELVNCTGMKYLVAKSTQISLMFDNVIAKQESLKRLKLMFMDIDFGWKWNTLFDKLIQLKEFTIKSSTLPSKTLFDQSQTFKANNNLISFSVNYCGIKSISPNLMRDWTKLKIISLAQNCISELSPLWFSSSLPNLWSLDLSYNSIESIPEHFFAGMTALRKLRLDNNSFKTLKHQWFAPIWERLHELWINGNSIHCNPDLSWIPNVTHPVFFDEGNCLSDITKLTRSFYEIDEYDADIIDSNQE